MAKKGNKVNKEAVNLIELLGQGDDSPWSLVCDSMSDGIAIIDTNDVILKANSSMAKMLGLPKSKIEGKRCYQVVHGTDEPIKSCPVLKMRSSKSTESSVIRRNGSFIEVTVDPLISDGVLVGAVHLMRDVSAEVESEGVYKDIIESSTAGIAIIQKDRFVYTNDSFGAIFGYKTPELDKMDEGAIYALIDPSERDQVQKRQRERMKGKNVLSSYIARAWNKKGKGIWIEVIASIVTFRGEPATQMTVLDVSEREEASRTCEVERDMNQMYLDVAGVMFVVLDRKGRVQVINQKGLDILGYTRVEVLGKSWISNFIPRRLRTEVRKVFKLLIEGEIELADYYENPVLCKDGSERMISFQNTVLHDDDGYINGTLSSGMDITSEREVLERLEESEQRYRAIVDNSRQGIIILRERPIYINTALATILGYEEKMLRKKVQAGKFFEFIHPQDRRTVANNMRDRLAGKNPPQKYVIRAMHKDGSWRWLEVFASTFKLEGKLTIQAFLNDITERYKATQQLDRIFNLSRDMFCIEDTNTSTFVRVNPAFTQVLGWDEEELLSKPFIEFVHPEDVKATIRSIEKKLKKGKTVFNLENRYKCKDGSYKWLEWTSHPVPEEGLTYAVARDVTEKKISEIEVERNQDLLNETERLAKVGGWEYDVVNDRILWTDQMYKILGVKKDQELSLDLLISLYVEEYRAMVQAAFWDAMKKAKPYDIEVEVYGPRDRKRWVRVIGQPIKDKSKIVKVRGNLIDVTNQKKMERIINKALGVSQQREKDLTALLSAAQQVMDIDEFEKAARILFDHARDVTGARSGYVALLSDDEQENEVLFLEAGGMPCTVDPELPMPIRGLRAEAYKKGKVVYDNEFSNSRWMKFMPKGHVGLSNVMFAPMRFGKKVVGIIGLANKEGDFNKHDVQMAAAFGDMAAIALQKSQSLESVRSSEEKYRSTVDSMGDAIHVIDKDMNLIVVNKAVKRLSKPMGSGTDLAGKNLFEAFPFLDNTIAEEYDTVFETGKIVISEEARTIKGKVVHIETRKIPIKKGKDVVEVITVLRDVSSRKIAEEELLRSERNLKKAQEIARFGSWVWNTTTNDMVISDTLYDILGLDPKMSVPPMDPEQMYVHPEDRELLAHSIARAVQDNEPYSMDYRAYKYGNMEEIHLHVETELETDEDSNLIIYGTVQDITIRKKAEKALQESEERLRFLTDNMADIIWMVNMNLGTTYVSPTIQKILGFTPEERNQQQIQDTMTPESLQRMQAGFAEELMEANKNGPDPNKSVTVEVEYYHKDGGTVWLENNMKWITNDDGIVTGILGVSRDVSKRKEAEQRLQNSLDEKEVLIKEVHHRVKNNLQMISSLFELQSDYITEPEVLQIFMDGQTRLRSMALIHEELYKSDDMGNIQSTDYIIRLIDHLYSVYGGRDLRVEIDKDIQKMQMDIDTAIPTGLIINELVSNSLKYAFKDVKKPKIKVKLTRTKKGVYKLEVSDNGIGLPEGLDLYSPPTLGLQLVNMLTRQLNGEFKTGKGRGTKFLVDFTGPRKKKKGA